MSDGELANSVEAAAGYAARIVLEQVDKFTPPHNLVEDEREARSRDPASDCVTAASDRKVKTS